MKGTAMSTATMNHRHSQGATATKDQPVSTDFEEFMKRSVRFKPLAEAEEITISVGMVRNILAVRSKSGRSPGDADIIKFMTLCKSRALNPFVQDAYLLGYDTQDGTTQWSLITAIQALRKRAEINKEYDGCRHGIILLINGELIEREGALTLDGERLVGGWAEVHRKDRKLPTRVTVKFSVYDTGRSRWKKDPSGMISKVAEAAGLREAFPSDLAGLYLREEFEGTGSEDAASAPGDAPRSVAPKDLNELAARIAPSPGPSDDRDDADQSRDESHDGIDEPAPDETAGDPQQMTPEESRDLEQQASGRTGSKGKQKTAFETHSNVGQ